MTETIARLVDRLEAKFDQHFERVQRTLLICDVGLWREDAARFRAAL
ncbi:hypothetical protein IWC96_15445 [Brevundimonas sp. BAL450]|jgi:hypothetical protein|uniref:Uncharacterized protein n=1 Tax=Brevundimonas abyssalis TAR-001 TaxID=1391729 RepID=A0A8E0KKJ3_9CAUL|nr:MULTISPECIES: hypothetical protein [Brevundimonas]MBG7616669.1 hypothetical protein [Brevundimonas sp. BAL450]GAD58525.1 hypothetical protein MBEBAB_0775 [Brevundimonas abyssalis TAR-001]